MKKLLFINADKDLPQCGVYQLGIGFNEFLQTCKSFSTTLFQSGSRSHQLTPSEINANYDLVIFNYHFLVMHYFNQEYFDSITIPKIVVNYESREFPWSSPCHLGNERSHYALTGTPQRELFDYLIAPDTSMGYQPDESIVQLPRIFKRANYEKRPINLVNPIISTYGLPAPQKDLIGMYNAICNEFDSATFRVHYTADSRTNNISMMRSMYDHCASNPRKGITLEWDDSFLETDAVPDWLNQSDLNIFFYYAERDIVTEGTFPASIDLAITAQRPIAVSNNKCTRFLQKYIAPYPTKSLKEIMVEFPIEKVYADGDPVLAVSILDQWIVKTFG